MSIKKLTISLLFILSVCLISPENAKSSTPQLQDLKNMNIIFQDTLISPDNALTKSNASESTDVPIYQGQTRSKTSSGNVSGCLDASASISSYDKNNFTVSVNSSYDFWSVRWTVFITAEENAPVGTQTSVTVTYKWTTATGSHSTSETFNIHVIDIPKEPLWELQFSSSNEDLNSVWFVDNQTGWAVGNSGTILYTKDAGNRWDIQDAGLSKNLNNVFFTDSLNGTIVGDQGCVLKTSDQGVTWQLFLTPTNRALNAAYFFSPDSGWVVSENGMIFFTDDGGNSWQATSTEESYNLYDITFFNHQKGWIVGESGRIYATTDGGATWIRQDADTYHTFYSVQFLSETLGLAAGAKSQLFVTFDGGNSWSQWTHGDLTFKSVCFTDVYSGWLIAENGYAFSTDDGSAWTYKGSGSLSDLNGIYFPSRNYGWIVGDEGTIVKIILPVDLYGTPNAGNSPLSVQFSNYCINGSTDFEWDFGDGGTSTLQSPAHTYTTEGYFNVTLTAETPYGSVTRTKGNLITIGSQIQADFYADPQDGSPPFEAQFTNQSTGSISGYEWDFGDGGTSTEKNPIHIYNEIGDYDVTLKVLGPLGDKEITKTAYIQVKNQTWIPQVSGTSHNLNKMFFINENKGWIIMDEGGYYSDGADSLLITTDGGMNWTMIPIGRHAVWNDIFFIDENTGWLCGDDSSLYKTTDGGLTWKLKNFGEGWDYTNIHFVDSDYGWVTVDFSYSDGTAYKTTDGGDTWIRPTAWPLEYDFDYSDVFFIDRNYGWLCSDIGYIYRTSNGGNSWKHNGNGTSADFKQLFFLDRYTGWAWDEHTNFLIKTTNNGEDWTKKFEWTQETSRATYYKSSMFFTSHNTGWTIVDSSFTNTSKIYKTNDGGNSWFRQRIMSKEDLTLNHLYFFNDSTGWAIGDNGIVLKLSNLYIPTDIEDKKASQAIYSESFQLAQNYPNPFNPTTTITYQLPQASQIKLTIYDIRGREIQTLINQKMNAGIHTIQWDASHVSSGVYFYHLETESFTKVKKCLLIR